METFEKQTKTYVDYIDTFLDKHCFQYDSQPQKVLFSSMRYSLLAGGKRIRPILVFEFCKMAGGNWQSAVDYAAAIEMIHTYSLVHDDLPCMDNDDYRRGLPTNHKVYGEAIATLAGDALLTAAFGYLARAPFDAATNISAVQVLSACAGELGMVGGQVLDILGETRKCSSQEVIDIHSRKTGALIRAACTMGVLAGKGSDKQIEAASEFAANLGLAFQIRDDMLDVIGDAASLGKNIGVDTHKNTFVHLYGLEACEQLVEEHTDRAINCLKAFADTGYMVALSRKLSSRTT